MKELIQTANKANSDLEEKVETLKTQIWSRESEVKKNDGTDV